MAAIAVVLGLTVGSFYYQSPAKDEVSHEEIAERTAEFAAVTTAQSIILPSVTTEERDRALASLDLTDVEKAALKSDVEDGRRRLVWLTLWDTHAEDGDVVLVSSEGLQQIVPIVHGKTRVAIPAPSTGVVNVTGVKDGGGGITIGVLSGSSRVRVPIMREGQVIGIPVAVAP